MRRRPPFPLVPLALASLLAVVAAGASGCGRDDDGSSPLVGTSVVVGHVGGCSAGYAAQVVFESVGSAAIVSTFVLTTGEAGGYQVELPAGDYLASARMSGSTSYYAATSPVRNRAEADTLRLRATGTPRVVDFHTGALRIAADVPAALEEAGFEFRVRSGPVQGDFLDMYEYFNPEVVDGHVEAFVPVLVPGDYTVEALWHRDWDRVGDRFWLPAASTEAEAERYHVGRDSTAEALFSLVDAPVRVSGRVTGAWQAFGMEAPLISLESPDGTTILAGEWQTGSDGRYEFDLCLPRPFRLKATVGNASLWYGGLRQEDATVFAPQPGQAITGLDLVGGGLRVESGLDIPGSRYSTAYFELYSPADLSLVGTWSAALDYRLGLANLPAGTWLLRVSRDLSDYYQSRWRPQWFDRAASAGAATPIVVPAGGGIVAVDLALELGGVIAGNGTGATDGDWRRVVLTRADTPSVLALRYIPPDGYGFRLAGLEDGLYRVGISPERAPRNGDLPPVGTNWYPGTADWAAAADIAIAGADSVGGLLIAVP